ncbi:linear amide C-N hydrolase [candidate division KSB1 bacterium]
MSKNKIRFFLFLIISAFVLSFTFFQENKAYLISDHDRLFKTSFAGIDTVNTLSSLRKENGIIKINYYGDYGKLLNDVENRMINRSGGNSSEEIRCSMFAAFGDAGNLLYGRNFDNPECGVLIGLYNPPGKLSSIAFSRINDLGFEKNVDINSLSFEERKPFLSAPFFAPDGINECGVTVALAYLRSLPVKADKDKKYTFVTHMVREILDNAKNIDEAVEIVKGMNVYDSNINTLSHHILISDPSGRSVIMEYYDGEMKVIPNTESFQVITNSPVYDRSLSSIKNTCWRYKNAFDLLKKFDGKVTREEGMDILQSVSVKGTQWSAVYDMKEKSVYVSLYRDYKTVTRISFIDF